MIDLDALNPNIKSIMSGPYLKKMLIFYWWIANLGVVPLFLFAAFLLAPAFFNLLALLILVTLVFETITLLLYNSKPISNLLFSLRFLPVSREKVKVILYLWPFISIYSPLHAVELSEKQNIVMAKGEIKEITFSSIKKYTIANKEILSHKLDKSKKSILLKGAKLGYTEFVVWAKDGSSTRYNIYVLSKREHKGLVYIYETLKKNGLKVSLNGKLILVTGEISTYESYKILRKLYSLSPNSIVINSELGQDLTRYVVGEIYSVFFNNYTDSISCTPKGHLLSCKYDDSSTIGQNILNKLSKSYFLEFKKNKLPLHKTNYRVTIELIQMEKVDGLDFSLGLNKVDMIVDDILSTNFASAISKNRIFLNERKIQLSTLAKPTALTKIDKKLSIEVGSEIPYTTTDDQKQNTSFKFAGLKVKMKLKLINSKLELEYSSEFTSPSPDNAIVGNKESGSIAVTLSSPIKLFDIMLKSTAKSKDGLPYISSIPLLGTIFSSSTTTSNHKKIVAILKVIKI